MDQFINLNWILYLIRHFSWLPQTVAKELINSLSQKVSYASMIIYPFINVFSPNEVRSHLHICDHSIITFGKIGFYLGFSNTSRVVSLDKFRKAVVEMVKLDIDHLIKQNHLK